MRHASTLVLYLATTLLAPGIAKAALDPGPVRPRLLLDIEGLADDPDPGDVFTTLGDDTALFYVWERDRGGTSDLDNFDDDTLRLSLWRTDGTRGGTFSLLPPDRSFAYPADTLNGLHFFVVCTRQNPIHFIGSLPPCDFGNRTELWRTDGTPEGTFRLLEGETPRLAYTGRSVTQAVPELGLFFFVTYSSDAGFELWASDGSRRGTRRVEDLSRFEALGGLVTQGGELYLPGFMEPPEPGVWIVRSDGTPEGTTSFPGPLDGNVPLAPLITGGDRLVLLVDELKQELDPATGHIRSLPSFWSLGRGETTFRRLGDIGEHLDNIYLTIRAKRESLFVSEHSLLRDATTLWGSDGKPDSLELLVQRPLSDHNPLIP